MTVFVKKAPLKRINVRLWTSDLEYLREHCSDNYNAQVRRIVAEWVHSDRSHSNARKEREVPPPRTG